MRSYCSLDDIMGSNTHTHTHTHTSSRADEVWPYISLDNIMDSITLHSSTMFLDLVLSLRWDAKKACRMISVGDDGSQVGF